MIYLWAFVVGGLICVIGQLMLDGLRLTPAHTTVCWWWREPFWTGSVYTNR